VNTGCHTHNSTGAKDSGRSPAILLEPLEPRLLLNADLRVTPAAVEATPLGAAIQIDLPGGQEQLSGDDPSVIRSYSVPSVAQAAGADELEGTARGESSFPAHPELYIPMPLPDPSESGEATDGEQLITYDVATGTISIGQGASLSAPGAGDETAYDRVAGGPGARADVSSEADTVFPLNFTDLALIANPAVSPWNVNVKLYMTIGGVNYVGSGVLIDPLHVLTAGHCVYWAGAWASSVTVVPAYDNGVRPYGDASAVQLHSWVGWTNSGDWDYDMGVIDLDRPIGALTGWHGYGYNDSPSFYTGNTFHNPGYPADTPYNGQDMYYWYGNFDYTESILGIWYGSEVGINKLSYGGQSGSGAYYIDAGGRYVYAVLSNGNSSQTNFPRITSSRFYDIRDDFIAGDTPATFDLIPLDVQVAPASIGAGGPLSSMSYVVENYSSASWSGTVNVEVYLSTNDIISSGDRLIQNHSFTWSFGAKSAVVINVTIPPTVPADVGPGNYWIGVRLNISDGNTANNYSDGQDAAPLSVLDSSAPTPNPMTWATEPYETSTSTIAMTATAATDATPLVQYYFDFVSSPTGGAGGLDSGWTTSRSFTNTGLGANHQYGYRVRARDSMPTPNVGGYSIISYDYTDIETPATIAFGTITTTSIQARSGTTPSGLTRGSSGLIVYNNTQGTNSGWKQNNDYWTSTSLAPNTQYAFTARARNGDADLTAASPASYAYTLANPPAAAPFSNVTQTSIRANWTANGNPSGTLYLCENTTASTNSGWTTNVYWNETGLTPDQPYHYQVRARNGNGVQTAIVDLGTQQTAGSGVAMTVAVAPASVLEDGAANLVYTFTRSGASSSALTVSFSVGGTATFNTDYTQTGAATFTGTSGTVTIAANQTTATVTVDPTPDTTVEPNETAILTVTAGTGYTVGTPSVATGTILNDDGVSVNLALGKATVASSSYPGLPSSNATDGNLSSRWSSQFSDNEWIYVDLGSVYNINRVVLRWEAAYGRAYSIQVSNDASRWSSVYGTAAGDGGVDDLTLAASGRYVRMLGTQRATAYGYSLWEFEVYGGGGGTPQVAVAVAPAAVAEDGAANLVYTFTRSGATAGALSVNFTVGGTATYNTDYTQIGAGSFTATSGTVTIAANQTTAMVMADPTPDTLVEPDETVILTVTAGTGYVVGTPSAATGTILDDDGGDLLRLPGREHHRRPAQHPLVEPILRQ
jgi:hypothetical protein